VQLAWTRCPFVSGTATIEQMTDILGDEFRRRRRDFIRAHHPDRGGDPEVFAAGLRAFGAGQDPDIGPLPQVVIIRRRAWLIRQAAVTRTLVPQVTRRPGHSEDGSGGRTQSCGTLGKTSPGRPKVVRMLVPRGPDRDCT
jgi:hypothetical protein